MATYSVYLKHDADSELVSSAKKLGISPLDLIRKRIAQGTETNQIKAANRKLDGLFFIMEILMREIGFTAGATRAGSVSNEKLWSGGSEREKQTTDTVRQCRNHLEKEGIGTQF